MSFTDNWAQAYEAPALAANVRQQTQQNAFDLLQKQRYINALQGFNVTDQNSVNNAMSGAVQAGMIDQAKAINEAATQRAIATSKLPVFQKASAQALQSLDQNPSGGAPTDIPAGFDAPTYQKLLDDSGAALNDLINTAPDQRAAKADQWRARMQSDKIPQAAIDGLGDLTDDVNLRSHLATVQREAREFALSNIPGAQMLRNLNNSGLTNPVTMGILANPGGDTGIDISGGLNLANQVASAQRQAEVGLTYAAPTAAATTVGGLAGQAAMIPTIQDIARAQAAGHTEGVPGQIPDPNTNAPVSGFWSLQNGQRVFHEGQIQPAAGGSAAVGAATPPLVPARGLGTAEAAAAATGGDQAQRIFNADNATAAGMQATVTPLRQILDKLPTTNVGPGTEQTNELRSFIIAQLPWLTKLDPTYWNEAKIQTAQYNELKKYMTQVATTGLNGVFGQGSDQRFAAIVSGNPHITMDQLSAKQVTELAMAGVRAQAAAPLVFARQGLPVTDYPAWKAKFGSTVDPRGFMLDILSPTERKAMLAQIPRNSTEAANLKTAKNYAEQIGMYQDSDIPR